MSNNNSSDGELNLPFPASTSKLIALPKSNYLWGLTVSGRIINSSLGATYQWEVKSNYTLNKEKSNAFWALYKGYMPAHPNRKNYVLYDYCKEKDGSLICRHDALQNSNLEVEPLSFGNSGEGLQRSIFTLALYSDDSFSEYKLSDFVTFRLSAVTGDTDSLDKITYLSVKPKGPNTVVNFECILTESLHSQYWCLFKGTVPSWTNINSNKIRWDWLNNAYYNSRTGRYSISTTINAIEGEIFSLILFKDMGNRYFDIGDFKIFRINSWDTSSGSLIYNIRPSNNSITFDYIVTGVVNHQWWVIYKGNMPSFNDCNKYKIKWDYVRKYNSATITVSLSLEKNSIYTLALFNDQSSKQYFLSDFKHFLIPS